MLLAESLAPQRCKHDGFRAHYRADVVIRRNILHLAPHPDDEALGAPATLIRLNAAGHRVVNVACSLGRADQIDRRRRELEEACRRLGVVLELLDPPVSISAEDDLDAAQSRLEEEFAALIRKHDADVVIGPTPHDAHHAHEVVGRAALSVCGGAGTRLWMWSVWGDIVYPTIFVPFDDEILRTASYALSAHEGEMVRNNYVRLLKGRAEATSALAIERVFGFGSSSERSSPYAEMLAETVHRAGEWWAGAPRELDPLNPLSPIPSDRPITTLLCRASMADLARATGRP